jgi:glycerate 2-kinase
VVTLAISDVPGDDPAVIASGPTVPDPTTFADARAIIARYGITPSAPAAHRLATATDETPKPGELPHSDFRLIATPIMSLRHAADVARGFGLTPLILGDALEGEAAQAGILFAGITHCVATHGQPLAPPAVLLAGGETTVTIGRGAAGRGGRNTEFLLSLAIGLGSHPEGTTPRIWAVAGDTDGIDGTEDAAGAIITPDTLARARTAGCDPRAVLTGHDSYTLFEAIGDLIKTGPTLTNVNDIRAILIV